MRAARRSRPQIAIGPIATMAVWLLCLAVGIAGLLVPYPWPRPPASDAAPAAEAVRVELIDAESPAPVDIDSQQSPPPPAAVQNPTPPPISAMPPLPESSPLVAVAAPSPAIAFPVPTTAPVTPAEPREAAPAAATSTAAAPSQPTSANPAQRSATATAANANTPQKLTFGRGEGRQPAPDYPREAAIAGQEGSVTLRFSVGEDGRITAVQAINGSRFPLLNLAALRAVRDTWRFKPGAVRAFEVTIEFKLSH